MDSLSLLRWLEEQYPEVNPTHNTSIEQVMYRAGQRDVVLRLIRELDPKGNRKL